MGLVKFKNKEKHKPNGKTVNEKKNVIEMELKADWGSYMANFIVFCDGVTFAWKGLRCLISSVPWGYDPLSNSKLC